MNLILLKLMYPLGVGHVASIQSKKFGTLIEINWDILFNIHQKGINISQIIINQINSTLSGKLYIKEYSKEILKINIENLINNEIIKLNNNEISCGHFHNGEVQAFLETLKNETNE